MRKLMFILVLVLFLMMPLSAEAQVNNWYTTNQATVAWDSGGSIVDVGERHMNVVYLTNFLTDPNKTNPVEVGRTDLGQLSVTIGVKGSYIAGVKTVLEVGEVGGTWTAVSESTVSWSDDPSVCENGSTFGIRFYPSPNAPGNFRPIP